MASVYGRGFYLDGTNHLNIKNFSMGGEFAFGFWYKASEFINLFSVDALDGTNFLQITREAYKEQKTLRMSMTLAAGT